MGQRPCGGALGAAVGAMLVSSLGGCVIQDLQYEVPRNYPPSIEASPFSVPSPNELVQLDSIPARDGGADQTIEFKFIVRDPNIDQPLFYQLFWRNRNRELTSLRMGQLSGGGDIERPLGIEIARSTFDEAGYCYRMELRVTSAFGSDGFAATEGDLATFTWYVIQGDVSPSLCPDAVR